MSSQCPLGFSDRIAPGEKYKNRSLYYFEYHVDILHVHVIVLTQFLPLSWPLSLFLLSFSTLESESLPPLLHMCVHSKSLDVLASAILSCFLSLAAVEWWECTSSILARSEQKVGGREGRNRVVPHSSEMTMTNRMTSLLMGLHIIRNNPSTPTEQENELLLQAILFLHLGFT